MSYDPPQIIELLKAFRTLQEAEKIHNTFLPPFHTSSSTRESSHFLHGNFNLGGTISGRLSSSQPNLTNLPSTGTRYAKPFKRIITAGSNPRPEWLFVGADYSSLENMISALLSKDPAKLAVYLNGIDAHCQNTYAYFKEEMPDIDPATPASINTIASKYPDHRQRSKTVTFALTYGAGVQGLVQNTQLNEKTARKLVRRYHELYKVSDLYTWQRLEECSEKGYTLLAFGLPLQTPVLKQTLLNSRRLTKEAHKEMKSVANAFIQSYGLLNTVSANRFMERVWNSPYRLDIFPVAQIHDSQYYLCRNSLRILHWLNINLIECMVKFDDLPEIFHTRVKLAADLEVYFPDWAHPRRIPNNASPEILLKHLREPP